MEIESREERVDLDLVRDIYIMICRITPIGGWEIREVASSKPCVRERGATGARCKKTLGRRTLKVVLVEAV